MRAEELNKKSVDELQNELGSLLKEQFNLRMQKATQQLQKPHLLRQVRKNIARIKTQLTNKAGENNE